MRRILNIALLCLTESIRDRIFNGLLAFLVLFLLFAIYVSNLSLGAVARFIMNTGMLGMSLICLLVTILFGLFALYREKERRELYVLLNRVPRHTYLLGRFLGTVVIIAIFSLVTAFGIFLLTWHFGQQAAPQIFLAAGWAIMEFSLLTAIGLLFYSLGLTFTLNALFLLAVFIMGHSFSEAVQSFTGLGQFGSPLHLGLIKTLSFLLPNFDLFDFRLAIVHGKALPAGRVLLACGYWLFYLIATLFLGSAVLGRRDI